METPFRVLTIHKDGVVLRSVPEGFVLRIKEGDVLMIDTGRTLDGKMTDVRGINPKANLHVNHLPHDPI